MFQTMLHMLSAKLLVLLMVAHLRTVNTSVNRCRSRLLQGCFCGPTYVDHGEQFVVNCTNMGFTTTDMLQQLPEETKMLIFTGNHIPVLPLNIFGNVSGLTVIDMSNNGIRDIKGRTFHHVSNVERLILNHNNILISDDADGNFHHPRVFSNFENLEELHLTNAFADNTDTALANDLHDIFVNSNLTKLYKLHLEQNEIKGFRDRNVFCDLPNLHQLYLGENFLPSLNFNVKCLKNLEFLDLQYNNITKFTQSELDSLDQLSYPFRKDSLTIDIGGNPFRCDNAISKLYGWLRKSNVTVRNKDSLKCVNSKYGSKPIFSLKNLAESKHAKFSKAITVLLVILAIILISLISAVAYLSREKIKSKLNPIFDIVSRKVQYTTIESQDV